MSMSAHRVLIQSGLPLRRPVGWAEKASALLLSLLLMALVLALVLALAPIVLVLALASDSDSVQGAPALPEQAPAPSIPM